MNSSTNQTNQTYYTITPTNPFESSWQPGVIINNNIQSEASINSNWKYRQYIQNNANHIMKYNTMEYIYASGNNPYSVTNKVPSSNVPLLFSSLYDQTQPSYDVANSDLKDSFISKQQLNGRMIAPSIATTKF
jgi:hypothetical protein